jgi:hypothetical protein
MAGAEATGGVVPAPVSRARSGAALWWSLSTGASVISTDGAAWHLHSTVALTLAAAGSATLLISALTLLVIVVVVTLHGSDEDREHLYRLLRWARNRPEPTGPPAVPADTSNAADGSDSGQGMKPGISAIGHANGPAREPRRMRAILPVLEEPLPDGVITLRQWAQRIDRAPSTIETHWRQRPCFPSPIGQLHSQSRRGGHIGQRLYAETQLDAWRMTQANLQQGERRSIPQL